MVPHPEVGHGRAEVVLLVAAVGAVGGAVAEAEDGDAPAGRPAAGALNLTYIFRSNTNACFSGAVPYT